MIELGKTGKQNVAFGVVSTLVNLTNSFDKQVNSQKKTFTQTQSKALKSRHNFLKSDIIKVFSSSKCLHVVSLKLFKVV